MPEKACATRPSSRSISARWSWLQIPRRIRTAQGRRRSTRPAKSSRSSTSCTPSRRRRRHRRAMNTPAGVKPMLAAYGWSGDHAGRIPQKHREGRRALERRFQRGVRRRAVGGGTPSAPARAQRNRYGCTTGCASPTLVAAPRATGISPPAPETRPSRPGRRAAAGCGWRSTRGRRDRRGQAAELRRLEIEEMALSKKKTRRRRATGW